jgi:hypothetical protein
MSTSPCSQTVRVFGSTSMPYPGIRTSGDDDEPVTPSIRLVVQIALADQPLG